MRTGAWMFQKESCNAANNFDANWNASPVCDPMFAVQKALHYSVYNSLLEYFSLEIIHHVSRSPLCSTGSNTLELYPRRWITRKWITTLKNHDIDQESVERWVH